MLRIISLFAICIFVACSKCPSGEYLYRTEDDAERSRIPREAPKEILWRDGSVSILFLNNFMEIEPSDTIEIVLNTEHFDFTLYKGTFLGTDNAHISRMPVLQKDEGMYWLQLYVIKKDGTFCITGDKGFCWTISLDEIIQQNILLYFYATRDELKVLPILR